MSRKTESLRFKFLKCNKKNKILLILSRLLICFILICSFSSEAIYDIIIDNITTNESTKKPILKTATAPNISVQLPNNYSLFGKVAPNYSISITGEPGNFTWYEFLNNGKKSNPKELNGVLNEVINDTFDQNLWDDLTNGTVTIRFYVNDSVGEIGYTDTILRIDVKDPDLEIIYPTGGFFNSTPPNFIIKVIEPHLSKCWYTLNLNTTKHFFEDNGSIEYNAWNIQPDGNIDINFFSNDTVGNQEFKPIQVVKDTISPTGSIIINNGDLWTNTTNVILSLNYNDVTSGVLEVRYSNGNLNWTAWEDASATRAWNLSSGEGIKTVYYEIKDNVAYISQFIDTIGLDTTPPTGSININSGDEWTNSTNVMLSLSYEDSISGVLEVRYSNDNVIWTAWETPNATRAWFLSAGDGIKTVYYEVKDNLCFINQFFDTIDLDTTAPTGSILINDGDDWTNSTSVMLSLTYEDSISGVLEVRYSNDNITWTAWETPNATRAWFLSAGDGIKTVYYEVKDNIGFINQFFDIIELDTTAPTGSILINDGDDWTNSTSVMLSLTYEDNISGVLEVRYSNNNITWTAWETPNATRAWFLSAGDGIKTVYYEVKDNLGFINQFFDIIELDTTAPTGSILINDGDNWTNSTSVMLSLTYEDNISGVLEVRYSNDNITWTAWELPSSTLAWTLFSGDGNKTVYYEIKDNVGFISQFNATIELDTVYPTGSITINNGDEWANSTSVVLSLTYNDGTSGVLEVRFSNDNINWTSWETPNATKAWFLSAGDGIKTVYFEIKDKAGLISKFIDSIDLDTTAPTGSILINDGDDWTNSTSVMLSLTYEDNISGVLEVRYSNDNITWTAWELPSATRAWTLFSGDGIKTVYYEIKDNMGIISQFNDTIGLDTTAPTGSILINDGDDWTNSTSVMLSLIYDDNLSGMLEVRYSNDNITWTVWELPSATLAWILSSGDGIKIVYYEIKDNAGIISQFIDTINLDNTSPNGSININNGDMWTKTTDVMLFLTFDDISSGVKEVRYSNDSVMWTTWEPASTTRAWILPVGDGFKTVYYEIKDNVGITAIFSDTIGLDTKPPILIINSPFNNSYWNTQPIISVSAIDLNLDDIWYRVGTYQRILDNNTEQALDINIWNSLENGQFEIHIWAIDNLDQISNIQILTLYKDTLAPRIQIILPHNTSYWSIEPQIHIIVSDPNFDSLWYVVQGKKIILTNGISQLLDSEIWYDLLDEQEFIINIFANDTFGYVNDSYKLILYKDIVIPVLEINIPGNNTYWNSPPQIQITVSDSYFDKVWYVVNGTIIMLENGIIDYLDSSIWTNLPDEYSFIVYFYANDSAGNMNNISYLNLYKDVLAPRISIYYPHDNDLFGRSSPEYNLSIDDKFIDQMWYTLDNEAKNYSILETTGVINQTAWNSFGDGNVIIKFYAKDILGNINFTEIIIQKDITEPIISIISPDENELFGANPPSFTIIKEGIDINMTWYSLDNGITNYTFQGTTVTINKSAWNLVENGTVNIKFYINDVVNNIGYDEILVRKDVISPLILVNSPSDNIWVNTCPTINLSVFDPNLKDVWYSVGTINITLTNNQEELLNQSIWNNLPQGEFKIYCYAIDYAHNLNCTIITLFKDTLAPIIIVNSPEKNSFWNVAPSINISVYDLNFEGDIWYSVSGYSPEILLNNTKEDLRNDIWNGLDQGEFQIIIWCSDIFDNISQIILTLYKDTNAPIIFINSPNNLTFYNFPPNIHLTIFDLQFDKAWYKIYSSSFGWTTNVPILNNTIQVLDDTIWNNLDQGEFQIYIYANDSFGLINNIYFLTLIKDTMTPIVFINSQINNTYWNLPPDIQVTVSDANFDSVWYIVGGTKVLLTNGISEPFNSVIWNTLPDEAPFLIHFYANDSASNENSLFSYIIYKDTLAPIVVINAPANSSYWNSLPDIQVTVSDTNFESVWYIVGGTKVMLVNGISEPFDSVIWNTLPDEVSFLIHFYANDSASNENSLFSYIIYKD
ncbi:MAG: hypothetical protein ACFE9Z_16095, partial [Promethearchaeota archaeon]